MYGMLFGVMFVMLIKDIELCLFEGEEVECGLNMFYLGVEESMFMNEYVGISFKVELVGSGILGVVLVWGLLMCVCGMVEVIVVDISVEYIFILDVFELVVMYF